MEGIDTDLELFSGRCSDFAAQRIKERRHEDYEAVKRFAPKVLATTLALTLALDLAMAMARAMATVFIV
eukprot:9759468-Heterocapsa_arctica.AAC.1